MLAFVFERSQCFDQCVTFTTHQKVQFIDVSIVQPMSSLLWDYRELFSLSIMIATAINTHKMICRICTVKAYNFEGETVSSVHAHTFQNSSYCRRTYHNTI